MCGRQVGWGGWGGESECALQGETLDSLCAHLLLDDDISFQFLISIAVLLSQKEEEEKREKKWIAGGGGVAGLKKTSGLQEPRIKRAVVISL